MAGPYAIVVERAAIKALEPAAAEDPGTRSRAHRCARARATSSRRETLQGQTTVLFRLRVGDYRVIYRVEDARLVVVVIDIGYRSEVYR